MRFKLEKVEVQWGKRQVSFVEGNYLIIDTVINNYLIIRNHSYVDNVY